MSVLYRRVYNLGLWWVYLIKVSIKVLFVGNFTWDDFLIIYNYIKMLSYDELELKFIFLGVLFDIIMRWPTLILLKNGTHLWKKSTWSFFDLVLLLCALNKTLIPISDNGLFFMLRNRSEVIQGRSGNENGSCKWRHSSFGSVAKCFQG